MSDQFYEGDALTTLKKLNCEFLNGFAFLFDIKNSSLLKRQDAARWHAQIEGFYRDIDELVKQLKVLFDDPNKRDLFPIDRAKFPIISKFVGDCGFIFVPRTHASGSSVDDEPPTLLSLDALRHARLARAA